MSILTTTSTADTLLQVANTARRFVANLKEGKRYFNGHEISAKLYSDSKQRQVFVVAFDTAIEDMDIVFHEDTYQIKSIVPGKFIYECWFFDGDGTRQNLHIQGTKKECMEFIGHRFPNYCRLGMRKKA